MRAGQSFAGYQLEAEIGRGTSGVVFRARSPKGQVVALKLLLDGAQASDYEQARFQREAQAVSKLDHPGIVGVYRHGYAQGYPFLAMRFVAGETLAQRLHRAGPPQPAETARILLGLTEAVQYAHERGVLHRDIKPQNVLLDEEDQPVLTDFGLARMELVQSMTRTGHLVGTPAYAAPEQLGGEAVDARADVYALGATLFHLLTGRVPFDTEGSSHVNLVTAVLTREAPTPSSVSDDAEIDPFLEEICVRCMRPAPADRYPSAWDLAEDLRAYLEDRVAGPPRRRSRAPALVLGIGGLLAAAGAGLWAASSRAPAPAEAAASPAPSEPLAPPPTSSPPSAPPSLTPTPTPAVVERWVVVETETAPPVRGHGVLVGVPPRAVLLFGGRDHQRYLGDTWLWSGSAWRQATGPGPTPRRAHAMAHDRQRGRVVLFGGVQPRTGYSNDTWEWDGRAWTRCEPAGEVPPPRSHHALVDTGGGEVLLYGGRTRGRILGDTWSWNGVRWRRRATPAAMQPRRNHGLAFDAKRRTVVLFGGRKDGPLDETWEWKGAWTQRHPPRAPGARRVPNAMAYDPRGERVLLFGGNSHRQLVGDTWGWDGTTWTRLATTGPAPRDWTHLATEPHTGRVLLFGGDQGDDAFTHDLWAWRSR